MSTSIGNERLSETLFGVNKVIRHKVNCLGKAQFLVEWSDGSKPSWEPLECLTDSPYLVKAYEDKARHEFSGRNDALHHTKFQHRAIPKKILLKMNHPIESYQLRGNEELVKIMGEIETKGKKGIKLWSVLFKNEPYAHYVSKEKISYYFPVYACMFMNECRS
jgi:hypothetical protein